MEPKAMKYILLGYPIENKGYKCYDQINKKVYISRDVKFSEFKSWYKPSPIKIEKEANQPYRVEVKQKMCREEDSTLDLPGSSESLSLIGLWLGKLSEE